MVGLRHAEGIDLGYAVVDRVARDLGVRVLAIKGPVAALHGLRPPRTSVDVDMLVEPARFDEVLTRLQDLRWLPAQISEGPSVLPPHSVTLRHPQWPIEIDLHHSFPGFLAPVSEVFELLWDDRVEAVLAQRRIPAAGLAGSFLVGTLHALRHMHIPRHTAEFELLMEFMTAAPGETRAEVIALAEATGALQTARPLIERFGAPREEVDPDRAEAFRSWTLRTRLVDTRVTPWLIELRRSSPRRRLPVLLRALLGASEAELRRNWPHAPPGRRGLWLARWWRLRRGLPHLPHAVRLVWRSRHP
jgi:hypothetical protein